MGVVDLLRAVDTDGCNYTTVVLHPSVSVKCNLAILLLSYCYYYITITISYCYINNNNNNLLLFSDTDSIQVLRMDALASRYAVASAYRSTYSTPTLPLFGTLGESPTQSPDRSMAGPGSVRATEASCCL